MFLVTAKQMQDMDRLTIESFGIPGRVLMENAGRGATRMLIERFPGIFQKKVGIFAGRGNNGGDGFVIARYLQEMGIKTTVYLLARKDKVKGDALANFKLLSPINVPVVEMPDPDAFINNKTSILHQDLLVDAILGTGLKSDVKDYFKQVIEFINGLKRPVFSVDIPSGLDSDNGLPCGACVKADATATFGFAKTGHFLFPGAKYVGDLEVIDIGIPAHIRKKVNPGQYLLTEDTVENYLKPRAFDAHKGSVGHLFVIGGSPGKTGAAAMAAISAMKSGAGLVTLGVPESLHPVLETMCLEPMTYPLAETKDGLVCESSFDKIMDLLSDKKCIAIGPGLGAGTSLKKLVCRVVAESRIPVVIDADGLNNLAGNLDVLKTAKAPIILTPHPGEMARLISSTPKTVQGDRIKCAREFAIDFNVHVVLKGARTIIAHPDGNVYINTTGNPGMASGGMGDVLTGIIGALIAQGYTPESAAHTGVYLHGAAADTLAGSNRPFGFLASEVAHGVPKEIGKLLGRG